MKNLVFSLFGIFDVTNYHHPRLERTKLQLKAHDREHIIATSLETNKNTNYNGDLQKAKHFCDFKIAYL